VAVCRLGEHGAGLERFEAARVGRAERAPQRACGCDLLLGQRAVVAVHVIAQRLQAELRDPDDLLDADEDQARASRRDEVEDLRELEDVVEVGLEPQHDLLVRRERSVETLVACSHVGERLRFGRPAAPGDEAGSLGAQLRAVSADGPFVQRVAPRQDVALRTRRAEALHRAVPVGHVQHRRSVAHDRMQRWRPSGAAPTLHGRCAACSSRCAR
jgi:hypothetical protein